MEIRELVEQTGISAKTIRYYESIGVLPQPKRKPNGYRVYSQLDVERVKLVAGSRRLGLSLDDIREVLAMRDKGEAPCRTILDLLAHKADEIHTRINELKHLEGELRRLYTVGLTFPNDDVTGKDCVCHLVSQLVKTKTNYSGRFTYYEN
jgi:DNA-binding transcriptional MerR regulator